MSAPRHALIVPLIVAGTFFMENLDGTVIATALPQMGGSFAVQPAALSIGITAYLLTLAIFIPISGWVADRFGARTVFGGAITVFTAASVVCGLSGSLWQFTGARVVQGIGGAMMVPVGRMVVLRSTDKRDLMRAMSTITWPGLVAPVLGPPVGGFITTYATWRWIFFLNVPLGLLALALVLWFIANDRGPERRPFDAVGFVLSGTALAGLMYGLDQIGNARADGAVTAAILLCCTALGLVAVRHSLRHPTPLLDLSPCRIPTFAANIWAGSLFRIAINTIPFLAPLLLQTLFGMSAFKAGLLILIGASGDLAMKTVTTPILRRFGFRIVLLVNGTCTATAIVAFSVLSPGVPEWLIAAVLLAGGICRSMQFTAFSTLAFADIPPQKTAPASTLTSMVIQMTLGMGVAFGAVALHLAALLHGGGSEAPTILDFRLAFAAAGCVAAASLLGIARLDRGAGASVTGRVGQPAPRRA